MISKILKSILLVVISIMLIISAVLYWMIPGIALLALAVGAFLIEGLISSKKLGWFALLPIVVVLLLGFAVWFPVGIIGIKAGTLELFLVLGGIISTTTLSYVWGK